MLDYPQALELLDTKIEPLPPVRLAIDAALNHVAASSLVSPIAVPPFANSAMDGFALRSATTTAASPAAPVRLRISATLTAGDAAPTKQPDDESAIEIMTGASLPAGYDTVIPLEQVAVEHDATGRPAAVVISEPVAANRNLRHSGEDFAAGDPLLEAGSKINASRIMGLAATGIAEIEVRPKPAVSMITTGNELAQNLKLDSGMIHDSNGPFLAAAAQALGLPVELADRCPDDPAALAATITRASTGSDVILTTGGVSAGRLDFVPAVLEQLGAEIIFHKVGIRPGKPILFARMSNGTLVFGLPGNPVAVAVGFRFFVVPALRKLQGQAAESFGSARLTTPLRKKPGMTFFAKAYTHEDAAGNRLVDILPGQESFKIGPLMQANCWAIAPAAAEQLDAGELIPIASTDPPLA